MKEYFGDTFSRFDTKHVCDRRTDRRTELAWHIYALEHAVARKNYVPTSRHCYVAARAT